MSNGFPPVPGAFSRELTARYRLITQAFIGDGEQNADGIRPPSFKGVMRYWWRCLNYGRIQTSTSSAKDAQIKLHQEEAALFGSASAQQQGQGVFLLQITQPEQATPVTYQRRNGTDFLAYGIWGDANRNARSGIPAQATFGVTLKLKPGCTEGQADQLTHVLWILGLLGNLGSRSRNGFGSLALEELNGRKQSPASLQDYRAQLHSVLEHYPKVSSSLPEFSAWSAQTRVSSMAASRTADACLANLGAHYMEFRKSKKGKAKIALGLPLADVDSRNRRASPLWFHIHQIGNEFHSICTFMPARFHPDYAQEDNNMLALGEQFLAKAQERLI